MRTVKQRIGYLERRVRRWSKLMRAIKSNQKHYLKKRMPTRKAHQKALRSALVRVKRLDENLKGLGITQAHTKVGKHSLFLCTPNQARKLRHIADADQRVGHAWRNKTNGQGNNNEEAQR